MFSCFRCKANSNSSEDYGCLECKFHPDDFSETSLFTKKIHSCCGMESGHPGCARIDHHVNYDDRKASLDLPYKIVPMYELTTSGEMPKFAKYEKNYRLVTSPDPKEITFVYSNGMKVAIDIQETQRALIEKYKEKKYAELLPVTRKEDAFNSSAPYRKNVYREFQSFIPFAIVALVGQVDKALIKEQ